MVKGQSDNTTNATKKIDYIAIADRLTTVIWSNYNHPTGGDCVFNKLKNFGENCIAPAGIRTWGFRLQSYCSTEWAKGDSLQPSQYQWLRADLNTVCWSGYSHHTCVDKPVFGNPTFSLPTTPV